MQYQECTGCNNAANNDGTPATPNPNISYGQNVPYRPQDVASEFGPRRLDEDSSTEYRYDWHGGVDYSRFGVEGNDDRGDGIVAIEKGTVVNIAASGNYKYIILDGVHDFGYGHIFHSGGLPQRSGNFVLTTLDNSTNDYAIVNTHTNQAIGEIEGTVTLVDNSTSPPTSTQYTVRTMVAVGQAFAPIGGSGGFSPHIHLYRYRNPENTPPNSFSNVIDPLSVVQYTSPNYLLELHTQNEEPGTIVLNYPIDQEETIKVNLWMDGATNGNGNTLNQGGRSNRYANGVIDIDQVELRMKNTDNPTADFETIQGPNFEAKITLGGRINTTVYPNNGLYLDNMEGNWNRSGITPFAYSDRNGQAKDEYYFADIALRIHKENMETTTCPMEVRYPDGNYAIRARATDVRNRFSESDEIEIAIDNFQPYIQSVQAQVGGTTVYEKEWICVDCTGEGGITFSGEDLETNVTYQDLEQGMQVMVTTSEPLQSLFINIPELSINNQGGTFSNDRTEWTFDLPTEAIAEAAVITFQFSGMDISENPILALQDFIENSCTSIPIRTGEETWSVNNIPTGTDESHSLGIGCGISGGRNRTGTTLIISSDDCLTINAETTNVSETGNQDGAIVLTVEGGLAPYQYSWDNGATTETIQNLSEGQYCVTITDSSCCEEEACFTVASGCMTFNVVTKDK